MTRALPLLLLLTACSPDRDFGRTSDAAQRPDAGCGADGDAGALGESCVVGLGACRATGRVICDEGRPRCDATPGVVEDEACNGADDDCDGAIDEGITPAPCDTGRPGACAPGISACRAGQSACTPERAPGVETCNDVDDDCDGAVDEAHDVDDDIDHCGGCDARCEPDNAVGRCRAGRCEVASCAEGWVDLDGLAISGCEYPCAGGSSAEVCDGIDDDCDGYVDEEIADPPTYAEGQGVCRGTHLVCVQGGWRELGPAGLAEQRPGTYDELDNACDHLDNDCDGHVDEGCHGDCGPGDAAPPCNGCGPIVVEALDGWVCLPPGRVSIGAPAGDAEAEDEAPETQIEHSRPLIIATREVTRTQWRATLDLAVDDGCAECPVDAVNWYEAIAYANRRSALSGLASCYVATGCAGDIGVDFACESVQRVDGECGFRLPTEAEAERYIRGSTDTRFWFGDEAAAAPVDVCWGRDPEAGLAACGSACQAPNPLGLCRVHGGVREWTQSAYQPYPGGMVDDSSAIGDVTGGVVVRGGAYDTDAEASRSRARHRLDPAARERGVGLRLVRGL